MIRESPYRAPWGFSNPHWQTIYPNLFRPLPPVPYRRERIPTRDGDVLDLDWWCLGRERLAILCHGLEGDSRRWYMRGMARALAGAGWDVLAWNFRGCGGSPNLQARFYHSGLTEDLDAVLGHALGRGAYREAAAIGFSLGGNLLLKYLGERGTRLPAALGRALAFSVPCDLAECAARLSLPANRFYLRRFLHSFRSKWLAKRKRFPDAVDYRRLARVRDMEEYDEYYTAPLHGFASAREYWRRCGCKAFLDGIRIPTLLLSSRDDPMLGPGSLPEREARDHRHLILELADRGGHIGFVRFNRDGHYGMEWRALEFLR